MPELLAFSLIGTSSLTLDGDNDVVNVGTALTLGHTQGLQFHTQALHVDGLDINNVNASGINTAAQFSATGGFNLGISSAGTSITDGPVKRLNFIGTGNTFLYNASTDIIDISIAGGGGGGASVTVSDDAPSSPSDGDLWFESDTADLKVYYNDGDSAQWVSASGGDSAVITSTSAPSNAQDGDLWYDSENGNLFVYYDDGDGAAQWVAL